MKFLSIYKTMERNGPPSQEELTRMGKLVEEGMKAGWLLGTEGCLQSRFGARVGLLNGKISVTDGPFAETKEVVGGFAILKADSKEEAIQLAKNFLQVVGAGECEIRCFREKAPVRSRRRTLSIFDWKRKTGRSRDVCWGERRGVSRQTHMSWVAANCVSMRGRDRLCRQRTYRCCFSRC